ncbi:MAG TPA: glycoside hydrolase family 15 protein [Stellaceae bacterium]|jgi:glucoamylase|nr:glycoside hydrolase family 15 protein [Stellaceae bacterium]
MNTQGGPTPPSEPEGHAPGGPGTTPSWTSSAKDFVGCGLGPARLWFTLGFGIVNEIYYPRVDSPQIRDLGFIVAGTDGFWSEVKRNQKYTLRMLAPGVPAIEISHDHPRYQLRLRITPDPRRDVLLIESRLEGDSELGLYVLVAPHLGATGYDNTARAERYRGRRVLWAEHAPFGMAVAAVDEHQHDAFGRTSAGYVGSSDGWHDFADDGAMSWQYRTAGPGNVALMGELPRNAVVAVGFADSTEAAATLAIASLIQPFDNVLLQQIADWERWQVSSSERSASTLDLPTAIRDQAAVSSIVLRAHLDKTYPGAMVASLSVPWGDTGDNRGGYHLVWPRDLVQCALALLALGAQPEARDTLRYLIATQAESGHWHQNQWLSGLPYWQGLQLDEAGWPVLLAAALEERDALRGIEVEDMVRRALGYIARTGPSTQQDRWEENEGLNPFTLAIGISALVAGGALLSGPAQHWALALADFWNAHLETWMTVRDTQLARQYQVGGYYVRVAPPVVLTQENANHAVMPIRNRRFETGLRGDEQIGTEYQQLVRFGLRRADDPLIQGSMRLSDALLRSDTPNGPAWHRYRDDGYGEHEDGSGFDGTGIGRAWPLLTGERGHFELCAGNDPLPYLTAMAVMASPGGMIPEQVWDSDPIPARRLFRGYATGSAMPLAWAHAEFVKLLASRQIGHPYDRPRAVWQRYAGQRPTATYAFWWPHAPVATMRVGAILAVALPVPAIVHWGHDGWQEIADTSTLDSGLDFHVAALETGLLPAGSSIEFTWRRVDNGAWAGSDARIAVVVPPAASDS